MTNCKFSLYRIALLLMLLPACKTRKPTAAILQSPPPTESTTSHKTKQSNEVLTVVLRAFYKADSQVAFEVHNIVKKEGVYKNLGRNRRGYFKATITDRSGNIIDSTFFENPLKQRLEYSEEDGRMKSETLNSSEGYTSIRMNYTGKIDVLNIYDDKGIMCSSLHITPK